MGDAELFEEEIFGFHAQQAIEKALKAWMVALRIDYPFSHDLSLLLGVLEKHGVTVHGARNVNPRGK